MTEFKDWLLGAKHRFERCQELLDSNKDPPEEPYKSKYEAKEILSALDSEIGDKWASLSDDVQVICLSSLLKYFLGVIAFETEELSAGCEYLNAAVERMKHLQLKPECCLIKINILNHLGVLWSARGESSDALKYLKEAEEAYDSFKNSSEVPPCTAANLFSLDLGENPQDGWDKLEVAFTHTTYYLAQVYEHLDENELAAKYCHLTLKRQMQSNKYDAVEWAGNCAMLSQYYSGKKMFEMAKHFLVCADYVIMKHEENEMKKEVENKDEDSWDQFQRCKANIATYWVKYCLILFSTSLSDDDDDDSGGANQQLSEKMIDHEDVLDMERIIICSIVKSYDEAKYLFLHGQRKVKEAICYYSLNDHANDYVDIIQDNSKLYRSLIPYEDDIGRKCKMHKRRISMLEATLKQLNPQFYLTACRQLLFELGEIYHDMTTLKLQLTVEAIRWNYPSQISDDKINYLITCGARHFETFIDTMKLPDKTLPDPFPSDLIRPAMVAYLYLGRLCHQYCGKNLDERCRNITKSKHYLNQLISYAEKYPDQRSEFEKELIVAKELIGYMDEKLGYLGPSKKIAD